MIRLPVLVATAVLAAGAFQVHRVRSRLSARDADPAAVARLKAGLDAIPMDLADDDFRIFNPGSPTDKRRQPYGTMGELIIDDGTLLGAKIIELR